MVNIKKFIQYFGEILPLIWIIYLTINLSFRIYYYMRGEWLVSSESYHWIRQDSDTCPRVDTCKQSNMSSDNFHRTQATPIWENGALLLKYLVITYKSQISFSLFIYIYIYIYNLIVTTIRGDSNHNLLKKESWQCH